MTRFFPVPGGVAGRRVGRSLALSANGRPLDGLSAAAAFSLRRLRSGYAGALHLGKWIAGGFQLTGVIRASLRWCQRR